MLLLKALRNRAVSRLWLGQVGSAIGDEVYRVAFIWMSVNFIGAETGYLASLQQLAVLLFSVLGGKWADRWSPYRTMIGVDLLRAIITLTPVILYYLHYPSFPALVVSTILLSGLGAFFEPALQAVLPVASKDYATLKAANGLMSTTLRLARVMGPAIIGLLSAFVETIHFFTINAFSYLFSTVSVFTIRKLIAHEHAPEAPKEEAVFSNLIASIKLTRTRPAVFRSLLFKSSMGAAWYLVYALGIALLIHSIASSDVKAFGLVMGAYGFGNVVSAMIIANFERKKSEQWIYCGLSLLGVGFILISIANSIPLLMLVAAITAVGGPMNDIPFTDLVQVQFPLRDLTKVFRLRMTLETLFTLLLMLASPFLFRMFGVRNVILWCGVFTFLFGLSGFLFMEKEKD